MKLKKSLFAEKIRALEILIFDQASNEKILKQLSDVIQTECYQNFHDLLRPQLEDTIEPLRFCADSTCFQSASKLINQPENN